MKTLEILRSANTSRVLITQVIVKSCDVAVEKDRRSLNYSRAAHPPIYIFNFEGLHSMMIGVTRFLARDCNTSMSSGSPPAVTEEG